MSRSNLSTALSLGLVLVLNVSVAWAQEAYSEPGVMTALTKASVNETKLFDVSQISVNDPAQADMLFKEGNTIASILAELKQKGFHIQYRAKQFPPNMTLQSLPTATDIDDVLREILEPWDFDIRRSPTGQWVVIPAKQDKREVSILMQDKAPEQ
ncbi:MAG TPA: hypothetical protein VIT67_21585 [Povalibacter sp.]